MDPFPTILRVIDCCIKYKYKYKNREIINNLSNLSLWVRAILKNKKFIRSDTQRQCDRPDSRSISKAGNRQDPAEDRRALGKINFIWRLKILRAKRNIYTISCALADSFNSYTLFTGRTYVLCCFCFLLFLH